MTTQLIEQELTYRIIGLIYEAYNKLGYGYQERYYQRALSQVLTRHQIPFRREVTHPIKVDGLIVGRYFFDFVISDRVIIELKVANEFYENYVNQVLAYLKVSGYEIALIAKISKDGVKIKRLVNSSASISEKNRRQ